MAHLVGNRAGVEARSSAARRAGLSEDEIALRLADARADGVDEAMTAKIDFYERSDLPERSKVALRITDAFILRPDLFFDAEQLAELCLDITKWSTQKIHVALGTDGTDRLPINESGTSFFGFDDGGRVAGFSAG